MKTMKQDEMPKKIWAFKKTSHDVLLNEQTISVPVVNVWNENNPEAVEYINLSQVWHNPNEEPKSNDELETFVLIVDEFGLSWVCGVDNRYHDETWEEYVTCYHVARWAYVSDLLPKEIHF